MQQYLEMMSHVLGQGTRKADRTGTGTLSVFGHQMRFDLARGFPLVTTKRVHTKSIFYELLWFLRGDTNVRWLQERGVTIWDEWADRQGELGPVYGRQWRSWGTPDGRHIDQMARVVEQLRSDPDSRRIIVSAWNVGELEQMALAPCHTFFAQQCDLAPGEFIWTGGDCHLYLNHLEQARLQLSRQPYPLPGLVLRRRPPSLFEYEFEDFEITGYQYHPAIKAPVAV
jgi:thymidylate synthase